MDGPACCAPRVMHARPGLSSAALDVQAPFPGQQGKTAHVSATDPFRGDEGDLPDDTRQVPGSVPDIDARPEYLRDVTVAAARIFLQPDTGLRPQQPGQLPRHGRIGFDCEHGSAYTISVSSPRAAKRSRATWSPAGLNSRTSGTGRDRARYLPLPKEWQGSTST